jgi:hypothetical protein
MNKPAETIEGLGQRELVDRLQVESASAIMERIARKLRLADWKDDPSCLELQFNTVSLLTDDEIKQLRNFQSADQREGVVREPWQAFMRGLTFPAKTPELAAAGLEKLVDAAIVGTLDDRIGKCGETMKKLEELKKMLGAVK